MARGHNTEGSVELRLEGRQLEEGLQKITQRLDQLDKLFDKIKGKGLIDEEKFARQKAEVEKAHTALTRVAGSVQNLAQKTNDLSTANRGQILNYQKFLGQLQAGLPLLDKNVQKIERLAGVTRQAAQASRQAAQEGQHMFDGSIRTARSVSELSLAISQLRNAVLLYMFVARPFIDAIKAGTQAFIEYERAMTGLISVGEKLRIGQDQLNNAVQGLTQDGLLEVTEASSALKILLSTGIGLDKALELMNALKDSAAFNRQGMLEFGQAIVGAADGIKNLNSRMIDNAGIAKNADRIILEYARSVGKSTNELTELEIQMALVNGIIKEANIFQGDAARLAGTTAGQFDKLDTTLQRASRSFGDLLAQTGAIALYVRAIDSLAQGVIRLRNALTPDERRNVEAAVELDADRDFVNSLRMMELQAQLQRARSEEQDIEEIVRNIRTERMPSGTRVVMPEAFPSSVIEARVREALEATSLKAFEETRQLTKELIVSEVEAGNVSPRQGVDLLMRFNKELKHVGDNLREIDRIQREMMKLSDLLQVEPGKPLRVERLLGDKQRTLLERIREETERVQAQAEPDTAERRIKVLEVRRNELLADLAKAFDSEELQKHPFYQDAVSGLRGAFNALIQRIGDEEMERQAELATKRVREHLQLILARQKQFQEKDRADIERERTRGELGADIRTQLAILRAGPEGSREQQVARLRQEEIERNRSLLNMASQAGLLDSEELKVALQQSAELFEEQVRRIEETDDRLQALSMSTSMVARGFGDMGRAARLVGERDLALFLRHAQLATQGLHDVFVGLNAIVEASKLSGLAKGAGIFGGAGLAIAGAVTLGTALLGRDEEAGASSQSERSRSFGASISRGPQTVHINPTLVVNSEGDVIFGEDGIAMVRDNLISQVQQAIDDGDLSLSKL